MDLLVIRSVINLSQFIMLHGNFVIKYMLYMVSDKFLVLARL